LDEILLASQRKDIDWSKRHQSGASSPNFHGGKYIDDKGYVRILMPEHPKNIRGYAYEHRLLMEKYLGRFLEAWETVHHINEIKEDNRLDNLFLCSHSEHSALHKEGAKSTLAHKNKMREVVSNTKPHTKKKNYSKKIQIKKTF
jgi:outer membrane cobalamin receptor